MYKNSYSTRMVEVEEVEEEEERSEAMLAEETTSDRWDRTQR